MVERGLNCQDVQIQAQVYTRIITEYLAGRRRPSPNQLKKLSEFFKVPPEYLIEDEYPWTLEKREAQMFNEDRLKQQAIAEYKLEQRRKAEAEAWLSS